MCRLVIWACLTQLKSTMDKYIPGRSSPKSITYNEIKRIVLTVASAVLNPGMCSFFRLMNPNLTVLAWLVRVSFNGECYLEHIKNSQVKHDDQVSKELDR